MSQRKHLSLETKLAAMTVLFFHIPYLDAKKMTKQQVNSLVQWDHNMLHESRHADRDEFWNFTPRLIREHREKTKRDAAVIAKGRRIRAKITGFGGIGLVPQMADAISAGLAEGARDAYDRIGKDDRYQDGWNRIWGKRKIRSRGFDKTRRRKMDGTVEEKTR